ncbi:MAG: 1-acyl-sn-glycerol-3-phosphate acyltransferase [Thermodesulfobacteriota bacterium]
MQRTIPPVMAASLRIIPDLAITLVLWTYYTAGFLVFFALWYLAAFPFAGWRETAYQRLNHFFYKGLFLLIRLLMPWRKLQIHPDVKAVRSSVVVSNHLSYLDPLLLMSIYPRHKTIVKSGLFGIPVFGRMLKLSGYMPSEAKGDFADILIRQMNRMPAFLASGGNLFIFPEGTRSRDGRLGEFNKGAFSIARRHGAPIAVVRIRNTDQLFQPGRFLFHTCGGSPIRVDLMGILPPDRQGPSGSTSQVMEKVRQLLEPQTRNPGPADTAGPD